MPVYQGASWAPGSIRHDTRHTSGHDPAAMVIGSAAGVLAPQDGSRGVTVRSCGTPPVTSTTMSNGPSTTGVMASATADAGARTATTGSVSSASAVPTAVGARRRLPTASTVAIEREGMRTKILRSGEKSPRLYRAREDAII